MRLSDRRLKYENQANGEACEVIDRVAKALYVKSRGFNPPDRIPSDDAERRAWMKWRELARVALAAMKEPTEAMLMAGCTSGSDEYCNGEDGNWHEWVNYDPTDVWCAMIDKALKE